MARSGKSINVGSVNVSVTPDATGFDASLARQITPEAEALGKRIGALVGNAIKSGVADGIAGGLKGSNTQARAQGARLGNDYAGSFTDAFRAKLTAALRALPDIKINANSSEADVKIAAIREKLATLSTQRIGIDIDEATAFTQLELLHAALAELNRGATTVQVKADTAAAGAQLAALIAEIERVASESPTVRVDADTAGADAALAGTAAEADALGSSASAAGGGFSGLIAAGIAVGPALIPVIAAVTAAVIALLSVLGAGIIGVGVLALGFSGISAGVQALDKHNKAAAASGASLASKQAAVESATRGVEQAELSLKNTRANAADAAIRSTEALKNAKAAEALAENTAADNTIKALDEVNTARENALALVVTNARQVASAEAQVVTAERNLAQAQQASLTAQQALNEARKTAQQQLEDLANQSIDGANNQRAAVLQVADAQDALNSANLSPASSAEDKAKAQLAFDQANQNLNEITLANQRLADKKAEADKAGVEGSQAVVTAQQNIVAAAQAVTDAQAAQADAAQNLRDVQVSTAEAAIKAQQAIADAVANATKVQQDGARNVAKAQQAVTDAIRAQATQQRQSADSIRQAINSVASAQAALSSANQSAAGGGAALAKQQDAFDKLTPAGKEFAKFVHDKLLPAFSGIRGAAQAGLLPGVEEAFKILLPLLPGLSKFVSQVAKALGDMFVNGAKALRDPFWTQFFGFASTTVIPVLKGIAQFIGDVIGGFAGLVEASAPLTGPLLSNILGMADGFKQFGEQAGTPGSPFQTFIGYVKQYGPIVADFFGNLFQIIGNLIQVFTPWGDLLLTVFADVTKVVAALGPKGLAFILAAVGGALVLLGGPMSVMIAAFTALGGGALYIYQNVKPVHDFINQHFLPLWHELSDYFTATVLPILKKIGGEALDGIKAGIGIVAQAISDHKPELEELYNTFKQAADFIVQHVLPVLGPILKLAFETVGANIAAFVIVVSTIVDAFDAIPGAATSVWNTVSDIFTTGVNDVIDVINFFIKALDHIPGVDIGVISHVGAAAHQANPNSIPVGNQNGGAGGHRLATGGVLPGYAPGVDSIRAVLSPGEGVLVPEAVRMLGPDWVYAMNAYASKGRSGPRDGYHFGIGGIVGDVTGAVDGVGHAIGSALGSVQHAAINTAVGTAKRFANSSLPPGLFRDMADGTLDRIGSSLKFADGGVVSPWGSILASGAGKYGGVGDLGAKATVVDARHQELNVHNHGRDMSPADIVTGWNQHHALHGAPLLAGAGL